MTGAAVHRLVPEPDRAPPLAGVDLALAAAFTLASLALHLALGQGFLYGDGAEFMVLLHEGAAGHKNHLAYLPLLRASAALGDLVGSSPYGAARFLSQAGAALGSGLFYLVGRHFGLVRRAAAWTAALVASTPSVVFFATVVEVHAPYFAFLALAWFATAHLARAPSTGRGALLGLACAAAYFTHASGLILPGPLLLIAWHAAAERRALVTPAVACALTHAALAAAVPWLLSHYGHVASPANAARFVGWWKMEVLERPAAALLVLWDEWLLAYLPLSLLWLRALWTARRSAAVALAVLTPYLALSLAFLAVYREFGAYHQAVVWLFAWLVVRSWRAPVLAAAVVLGLAVAVSKVDCGDEHERVAAYTRGLGEATGSADPLLLVGDVVDYEHCFIAAPGSRFVNLATAAFADRRTVAGAIAALDQQIATHRALGGRVFLTAGAVGLLGTQAGPAPDSGFAVLLQHLQGRYRRVVVGAEAFRAFELVPLD